MRVVERIEVFEYLLCESCLGEVQGGRSRDNSLIAACHMQQNSIRSIRLVMFVAMGVLPAISALRALHPNG